MDWVRAPVTGLCPELAAPYSGGIEGHSNFGPLELWAQPRPKEAVHFRLSTASRVEMAPDAGLLTLRV